MSPLAASSKRPPRILWIFYGIAVLTFLYALGKETWVHPFMVKHLPLFGAFRVPGRIVSGSRSRFLPSSRGCCAGEPLRALRRRDRRARALRQ